MTATTIVVLCIVVALFTGINLTRGYVSGLSDTAEQIRSTRALATAALAQQVDEETGLRGYAATRDRQFLEPYTGGLAQGDVLARVATALDGLGSQSLVPAVRDASDIHEKWMRLVATPLLSAHVNHTLPIERQGKFLLDRFRSDMTLVTRRLDERERTVDADARSAIDRLGLLVLAAIVGIIAATATFIVQQLRVGAQINAQRSRIEADRLRSTELLTAYETEKRIAATLQNALSQRPLPILPTLQLSANYVPAVERTKVGGDWYDALEVPDDQVLFVIGDVAGHGIDASVSMSQARQSLISAALLDRDPAHVLTRANRHLIQKKVRMATAIVGLADPRTHEFVYATAGHPPPVLFEPGRFPRLLECGSLPLSVTQKPVYHTRRVHSVPGAMLVIYTDGALEYFHDVIEGEVALLAAVARVADTPELDAAPLIHNAIFQGRPVGDDVAILTIRFTEETANGAAVSADERKAA